MGACAGKLEHVGNGALRVRFVPANSNAINKPLNVETKSHKKAGVSNEDSAARLCSTMLPMLAILCYTCLVAPLATLCVTIPAPGCIGAEKGAGYKPICAVYASSSGSGGKAGRVGFCKCGGSKAKLARARSSLLLRGPRAVRVSRGRNKLPQTDDSRAMGYGNCKFRLLPWTFA